MDLASFELLGFDYPGATIAVACLLCGLWNIKEESLEEPQRLPQVLEFMRSEVGARLLGTDAGAVVAHEVLACMEKLSKAFVTLEQDHARIAAEKDAAKHGEKASKPPMRPTTPLPPATLAAGAEQHKPLSPLSAGRPTSAAGASASDGAERPACPVVPPTATALAAASAVGSSPASTSCALDATAPQGSSKCNIGRTDSIETVLWTGTGTQQSETVANSEVAATVDGSCKDFQPVCEQQAERSESPDDWIAPPITAGERQPKGPTLLKRKAAAKAHETRREPSHRRRVH